ncbi:MAG: membrane protein insertion efficiency factor YidD [Dehalococcoidales bacterium]|nr:membrane protein insertion efficiency factor YidD [Dehalococcoidales bacterium]
MTKRLILDLIELYQTTISEVTPHSCRYQPTCSHYAHGAIERYGFIKGSWLATKRLTRCNPFSRGGYDPVP